MFALSGAASFLHFSHIAYKWRLQVKWYLCCWVVPIVFVVSLWLQQLLIWLVHICQVPCLMDRHSTHLTTRNSLSRPSYLDLSNFPCQFSFSMMWTGCASNEVCKCFPTLLYIKSFPSFAGYSCSPMFICTVSPTHARHGPNMNWIMKKSSFRSIFCSFHWFITTLCQHNIIN